MARSTTEESCAAAHAAFLVTYARPGSMLPRRTIREGNIERAQAMPAAILFLPAAKCRENAARRVRRVGCGFRQEGCWCGGAAGGAASSVRRTVLQTSGPQPSARGSHAVVEVPPVAGGQTFSRRTNERNRAEEEAVEGLQEKEVAYLSSSTPPSPSSHGKGPAAACHIPACFIQSGGRRAAHFLPSAMSKCSRPDMEKS